MGIRTLKEEKVVKTEGSIDDAVIVVESKGLLTVIFEHVTPEEVNELLAKRVEQKKQKKNDEPKKS